MKKRLYWADGESPFVEWCDLLDKKSLRINLSKVIFDTENNFKSHLEVLKKISDKQAYYEADDCERFLFDVFASDGEIEGSIKIYLSKVKYSVQHKKSNGLLFRLDAYALIDIDDQLIDDGMSSENTILKVKNLEKKIWDSYRENKLAI